MSEIGDSGAGWIVIIVVWLIVFAVTASIISLIATPFGGIPSGLLLASKAASAIAQSMAKQKL